MENVQPIPMILYCHECGNRHIDKGEFASKPHHTHSCQQCGFTWRPAVVPTVGVQFLPGFKDDDIQTDIGVNSSSERPSTTEHKSGSIIVQRCNYQYKVITSTEARDISNRVTEAMNEGWDLVGDMKDAGHRYSQAMIKVNINRSVIESKQT